MKRYLIDSGEWTEIETGESEEEALLRALQRAATKGVPLLGLGDYFRVTEIVKEPHYFETPHWVEKVGGKAVKR